MSVPRISHFLRMHYINLFLKFCNILHENSQHGEHCHKTVLVIVLETLSASIHVCTQQIGLKFLFSFRLVFVMTKDSM